MRFRLSTLIIVLKIVPPVLWAGWMRNETWRAEREQLRSRREWLDQFGVLPLPDALRKDPP